MAKSPTQPFTPQATPAAPRTTFDRAFAIDVLLDAGFPQSDVDALLSPLRLEPGTIQVMDAEPRELSRDEIAIRFAAGRAAHPSALRSPMADNELNAIAMDGLRFADAFVHMRHLRKRELEK